MSEHSDRIVVGVDGSEGSEAALDWATGEATLRGALLDVVHVWDVTVTATADLLPMQEDPAVAEARGKELLDEAVYAASCRAALPPTVKQTLVRGVPAEELEHRSKGALELVVGSRGLGAVAGAVLGSVSEHCCEHASTTVTVVPHRSAPLPKDDLVAVGVDGSIQSFEALRWAATAAGLRHAPLLIVHVFAPSALSVAVNAPNDARPTAMALLEDMATTIEDIAPAPTAILPLAVHGHPRHGLLTAARQATLLVVGARGHTGVRRLLGSVSRACAHHSHCPVTIVRAREAADDGA